MLRDHQEIVPRTWQLRYDFAGSTVEFLERTWAGVDLSNHSTTYFLWGVPPVDLFATLSRRFARVFVVLDIGCFSELQRHEQIRRGLLKPCPSDAELMKVIEASRHYPNLELEVSGIAGLPFANEFTLKQEVKLVEKVLSLGLAVGYQRLEAQPGALVTEHPGRFEMVTEARTLAEFLDYFALRDAGEVTVPMVRFRDSALEAAVARTTQQLESLVHERAAAASGVALEDHTRLQNRSAATLRMPLGEWLGRHRVPERVAHEPVTVVRSVNGMGLSCAPSVSTRRFADPLLQQGESAAAVLAVLAAFERPSTLASALGRLASTSRLDGHSAREVIEHLSIGRFLQPAG